MAYLVSFVEQIARDRGQPATVRVGTIVSVDPVQVSIQGTVFNDAGFLGDYAPQLGDVVTVLGQSAVSADGSSWLVLGEASTGPSARADVRVLAATGRDDTFDSATFTTTEVVIGGSWNLTVPLPAGHLVELFMTFNLALNTGVANHVTMRIREDSLTGTQVFGKHFLLGPGNNYYSQVISAWLYPNLSVDQLYVVTAVAPIAGTGQFNVAAGDIFIARDHGLASFVNVV